jgi:hypothetical protein
VAYDYNKTNSSSDEEANMTLMASHHSNDEQEVNDYELNDKPSYEELQSAFYELHEECSSLSRTYAK